MDSETQINFIPAEHEFPPINKKPRKPRAPKKPMPETQKSPEPQKETIKTNYPNPKNEPKETLGYDTLNPFLYKFANYLLLPGLVVFICSLIATIICFIFFPKLILELYGGIICTVFSLIVFVLIFLITSTSLKRGDLIIIRKFRSGSGTISRLNLKGKSELLFDKKDIGSKVLISWAGAITDPISGCKIIQISEGHPTNDNLNSQVTESEWDKDVARLTKAKSVADLAEAELFNQGLFGLKWQDIVLVIIGILCLAIMGYLIMGAPEAIAKKTIEGLMNGTIQTAIQQGLANAGILTPVTK